MSPTGLMFLGLTAIIAALAAVLLFGVVRIFSAARASGSRLRQGGAETALLSVALQEAVTNLRAQERAMTLRAEASERLSEEIIASLSAGLLVVNLSGEVQIVNPAGRRLLGLDEGPHRGADYRALLAHAVPVEALIDQCLSSGRPIVRRVVEMPAGHTGASHVGLTVSPLFGESSDLQGAICLFTDLTTVVALEEQLRLKDSLARVGELTAGIAHEFRNGLATIHGYSKLFDLNELPKLYRPYVEGIRAETESLSQVVTNFLNFARPAQLTLTRVDLRAICERAAEEIRPDAQAVGGDVVVSGEFGAVEGDEVLLRQAFSNLLRNAIEACAGAPVAAVVAIRSEVDPVLKVSRITVNDNGPGIPAASRERIFQPFFTSKRNGTGLGLALVQKIIVFHNGRVVAGTAPAGGASLQVTLPLAGDHFQERYSL
jgi:signal transduction histidine kinase